MSRETDPYGDQGASGERIRILLVDDQHMVRAGLRIILESEDDLEVVAEAADGCQAVAAARTHRPDVVLMDVEMPRMNGLEATRQITAQAIGDQPAVLILTTFDRDEYLFEALQAGASGFVLKNGTPEDLIDAVHVLARGDALLSPEITRRVIATFAVARPKARAVVFEAVSAAVHTVVPAGVRAGAPVEVVSGVLLELTSRERQVLALVARGASNAEIAAELVLGETTVKTHVSRILTKLGLRDRTQAVVFAYEHGVVTPQVDLSSRSRTSKIDL